MFCYGEDVYLIDVLQNNTQKDANKKFPHKDKTGSASNFYSYRIMVRK